MKAIPQNKIVKVTHKTKSHKGDVTEKNRVTLLILHDPSGAPSPPSARWGSAREGKTDKSQKLEISITPALGVSRSITSKSRASPDPCGTCVG
jgi:hypothetical protein